MKEFGFIHIYTGDGKGKTTASIGLSVRALGSGAGVLFVQFMKGMDSGEIKPLKDLGITVVRATDNKKFIFEMSQEELSVYKKEHRQAFEFAKTHCDEYDLIVFDEIISAVNTSVLSIDELLGFIDSKPQNLELVLTGRDPSEDLIERADYVSEIIAVKHPYSKGTPARKGIEY